MYKVLIADDDRQVRNMLIRTIDWKGLAFTNVDEVSDGKEAVEYLCDQGADLLLLDISMPQMNGIEVIEAVKEHDLQIEIIILSCHDDFHYVKEAMRLGASEYMLKHLLTEEVLVKEIRRAKLRIKEQRDNSKIKYHELRKKRIEQRHMKNELLLGIMKNGTTAAFSDERLRDFYKDIQSGTYCMVMMYLDDYKDVVEQYNPDGKDILYMSVMNVFREICGDIVERALVDDRQGLFVLLLEINTLGEAEITKQIEQLVVRLRLAMKQYLDMVFRCVFSPDRITYTDLHESYCRLQSKSSQLFYQNTSIINERQYDQLIDKSNLVEPIKINQIRHAIKENDVNELVEIYRAHLKTLQGHHTKPTMVRNQAIGLLFDIQMVHEEINGLDLVGGKIDDLVRTIQIAYEEKSLNEAIDLVADYFKETLLSNVDSNVDNVYIKKAITYIKGHYKENISLNQVADYIHVNPTYLSNLFKGCIDINYVDYVKEVRVKKACDLLENSGMKVKDVGTSVGIPNRKYFSKIFKHVIGMSPLEYKKSKL